MGMGYDDPRNRGESDKVRTLEDDFCEVGARGRIYISRKRSSPTGVVHQYPFVFTNFHTGGGFGDPQKRLGIITPSGPMSVYIDSHTFGSPRATFEQASPLLDKIASGDVGGISLDDLHPDLVRQYHDSKQPNLFERGRVSIGSA